MDSQPERRNVSDINQVAPQDHVNPVAGDAFSVNYYLVDDPSINSDDRVNYASFHPLLFCADNTSMLDYSTPSHPYSSPSHPAMSCEDHDHKSNVVFEDILTQDSSTPFHSASIEQVNHTNASPFLMTDYNLPVPISSVSDNQLLALDWPTNLTTNQSEQQQIVVARTDDKKEMFVANTGMEANGVKKESGLLASGRSMAQPFNSTPVNAPQEDLLTLAQPLVSVPQEDLLTLDRPLSERKKSSRWSMDEQRLFLKGLETYGRGNWKAISENILKTRTPSQIASKAQKFYGRLGKEENQKKRKSINDIATFSQ